MLSKHRSGPVILGLAAVSIFQIPELSAQDAAQELERVFNDPAVQRALAHVDETDARTIEDLINLTEIPAPPFMEDERGRAFAELLTEIGIDSVWTDEVGNVIGRRNGRSRELGALAIAGHLDTVFPEGTDVTVQTRGDTLFAPGIGDDTRGLATVLAILRAMNAADIETERDVLFIGDVGEEGLGDLRGMKHLFRNGGPNIASFISIDGVSESRVTHMGLGSHRYRVRFIGPGGHSWGAFGLANPAHAMGRAITYFDLAADAFTRGGVRTSYNVGIVEGGTSVNSIPFETAILVDMRSESQDRLVEIDSIFRRSMRKAVEEVNLARRDGPPLTVAIEMIGDRPSGETPVSDPLVRRAVAATELLGIEPRLTRSSTDSNIPISMGIPALTLGGGGIGGGAHSPQEWFVNQDGTRGIKRALLVVLAQAGLVPIS